MIDALTPFHFEQRAARGAFVDLRANLDTMLGHRDYPADVRALLGEALAVSPLLASQLKFEGRINLQFQGAGPVSLLVTQIDHELKLRGMAKAADDASGNLQALLGGGTLALMLEPLKGRQNYQALVSVVGENLAAALEEYYAQSEQLPTRLCLAAGPDRLCGLMLQRMPGHDTAEDDAYWDHLTTLFATLGPRELLDIDGATLLRRLFHAEPLQVFAPRPVTLACACTHASISGLLLALGRDELEPLLIERGKVEVTCEFCGKPSVYSALEVHELFAAHAANVSSRDVRH